jgi:hypothetical protein
MTLSFTRWVVPNLLNKYGALIFKCQAVTLIGLTDNLNMKALHSFESRSQWPCSLSHRYAATHLLRLRVWIPPDAWMFVCCECCLLPGRGLCNELIAHPEESYQLWCIVVCDLETSWMRRAWPTGGWCTRNKHQEPLIWHQSVTSQKTIIKNRQVIPKKIYLISMLTLMWIYALLTYSLHEAESFLRS